MFFPSIENIIGSPQMVSQLISKYWSNAAWLSCSIDYTFLNVSSLLPLGGLVLSDSWACSSRHLGSQGSSHLVRISSGHLGPDCWLAMVVVKICQVWTKTAKEEETSRKGSFLGRKHVRPTANTAGCILCCSKIKDRGDQINPWGAQQIWAKRGSWLKHSLDICQA